MSRGRAFRRHQKNRARGRAERFMFEIKGHDPDSDFAKRLVHAYTSDRRISRQSVATSSLRQERSAALRHAEGMEEL